MTLRLRTIAFLILLLPLAGFAQEGTTPSVDEWALALGRDYSILPNVTYAVAEGVECKLDAFIRRSADGPVPTLIHIHGGGWVTGMKETAILSLLPYIALGYSIVNVEYRLARVSLAPAAVEDCRQALRWVYRNAEKHGFDTTRIVVTGGSAGGHLALMTGMAHPDSGFDAPREWDYSKPSMKVAAIINWYGITDVADLLSGPNQQAYAVSWLGGQPGREALARRVSPLSYVRRDLPPILSIHGDRDQLVPYSHGVRLHEALDAVGVPNHLVTIPGGRHGGFAPEEMSMIYGVIREFLAEHELLPHRPPQR
jgi:acetyl esterase/lipase